MANLTTEQATIIVDQKEPQKRCENDNFCYWHCSGSLGGYNYNSQRVDNETLASDSTLSQSRTYFINYFKTLKYKGVKPNITDETPE